MTIKYYYESVGECVSQVYELNAINWEDARREAFDEMDVGDILAGCEPNAIIYNGDYASIDKDKCIEIATLKKGAWAKYADLPDGVEYWESEAWFFDDDSETYYNGNFEEFTEWESSYDEDED